MPPHRASTKTGHVRTLRRANKATASQLLAAVSRVSDLKNVGYFIQVATSSELSEVDHMDIWNIFEHNMQNMLTGTSMGWDPPSKKQEIFHQDTHFIILRCLQAQDGLEHIHEGPIMAYSTFRFEMENGECVLYCYELQLELQASKFVQQGGTGKTLMRCLCEIARQWKMQKVVLSVLKEKQAAYLFYKSMGFNDESESAWEDFVILSKSLIP